MITDYPVCSGGHGEFGFTVLGSGSQGNATVIHSPEGMLLLDAGFSARELQRRMALRDIDPSGIRALLLTHAHTDHISGCRVFADRFGIPAYMTASVYQELDKHKDCPKQVTVIEPGNAFDLCGVTVDPFPVMHDVEAVAYIFIHGGSRIGYATDLGYVSMPVVAKLHGCDAIVLESNYDTGTLVASRRPEGVKRRILSRQGHLSNDSAIEALDQILTDRTKQVVFAHLSRECNDFDMVEQGLRLALKRMSRSDVFCEVARQDMPLETLWIGTAGKERSDA